MWQTVDCGYLDSEGREEMLQTLLKKSKSLSKKLKLKFVTTAALCLDTRQYNKCI